MRCLVLLLVLGSGACQPPPAAPPTSAPAAEPPRAPANEAFAPPSPLPEPDLETPMSPSFAAEDCRKRRHPPVVGDVDWCDADLRDGLAHLRDGIGEMHEYEDLGGPHDTHIFRLLDLVLLASGDRLALVVREEDYFASGGEHRSLRLYVYERPEGQWQLLDVQGAADAPEVALREHAGQLLLWTRSPERACRSRWAPTQRALETRCVEAPSSGR